jgi:hypothetical protein
MNTIDSGVIYTKQFGDQTRRLNNKGDRVWRCSTSPGKTAADRCAAVKSRSPCKKKDGEQRREKKTGAIDVCIRLEGFGITKLNVESSHKRLAVKKITIS